jgi:hypothetical protein
VSVGGIDLFHSIYHPLLFDTLKAEPGDAGHLERLLAAHRGEVAAVIMEPLVQGAAGMLVHPEGYLRSVRELCDRYDTLLILDEVATGCGRTFACEHEEVAPDLMCLAKGISGGYLPLAATLASERVYEGVLGEHEEFRTFFHGHTYTGNPLACAAAIASLDVFSEEETLARLQPKLDLLGGLLEPIAAQPETLPGERRARPCAWRRCAGTLRGFRRVGVLALVLLEVLLPSAADRAEPVVRDVLERGSGRDAAVGIALRGVIDEAAGGADPLLGGQRLAHERRIE